MGKVSEFSKGLRVIFWAEQLKKTPCILIICLFVQRIQKEIKSHKRSLGLWGLVRSALNVSVSISTTSSRGIQSRTSGFYCREIAWFGNLKIIIFFVTIVMIVIMIAITTIVMDTTMIITLIIVTIIKPRTWQLVPQDCYQLADNLTQTRDDLRDNDWVIELLLWFCQYCQDMFCRYPPLVKMSTELWSFWRWVQCSTFCKTLQMTLTPLSTHAHLDQMSHTAFILSSDQKQQLPMCNSWKMWIKIKPRSDGLFSSMYVHQSFKRKYVGIRYIWGDWRQHHIRP